MSTQELSKCCVCGQVATKRCEPCGARDVDLFFCSPEHQKLVWDAHKQVCGDKANPFTSPPLSAKEAALAKALADLEYKFDLSAPGTPAHFATEGSGVTLATHMETLHRLPPGSFVKSLIAYYQKAHPEFAAYEDFLSSLRPTLLDAMYSHAVKPAEARAVVKRGLEASEILYVDRMRETVRFELEEDVPPLVITHMRHHALILKNFVLAAFVRMLDPVIPYLIFESPYDFNHFIGAIAKEVTVINSRSVMMEYSTLTRKITAFREGTVAQPEYE
ncbi:hypothetical protein NBRC10512_008236 [Rhodotorula toruloides]